MKLQSIEQVLAGQDTAFIQTVGVSMEPMLHARESTVVLESPRARPVRGDVVLFKRQDGQYVLHRVIRVRARDCLVRGDNCLGYEVIPDAMIVGVMQGYYEHADSGYVPKDDLRYQRYVRTLDFRHAMLRMKWLLHRLLRRIKQIIRRKH